MKTSPPGRLLSLSFALALAWPARGMVLTNDTTISATNQTYEGQDLVVSNAVLTVDGPHTFNGLRLAAGATLTHSPDGSVIFVAAIANEPVPLTDTNAVPLANFDVVPGSVVVTDTNGLVLYTNEVDYSLTSLGSVLTIQRTTNSLIADGDTVFVSYNFQTTAGSGLRLTLTGDFELEPGASVNVNGRGYGGNQPGPGGGRTGGSPASGSGGGFGGFGGLSSGNAPGGPAYGAPTSANQLGSSGGEGAGGGGGAGGGKIQLTAGGTCLLNGIVSADGQNATNSRAGGGSGGSIWISAQTLSGAGALLANGGAGEPVHGGGGGGGRIVLNAATNEFTGAISAAGGAGWQRGGAGTIYLVTNAAPSRLLFDNGGVAGAASPLVTGGLAILEVRGHAAVLVESGVQQNLRSLLVRSNSSLTTTATNLATLNLAVASDVLVEQTAVISLAGKGYSPNLGPGAVPSGTVAGGAGHAGYGGSGRLYTTVAPGGNTYGSILSPTTHGSGGRTIGRFLGGAGGGVLQMAITGKLQLDGLITADATPASGDVSGGASGGSVWLMLGGFSGSGVLSANGGAGGLPSGGGGGGGRIAITCNSNSFTGTLRAVGGAGAVAGGAGVIYTRLNRSSYGEIRADNGGAAGTNTVSDLSLSQNLTVLGGAVLRPSVSSLSLGEIRVGANSTLLLGSGSLTVSSNVIVEAGGSISGDGLGFSSGSGTGLGQSSSLGSTGGGHGGYGGRGAGFTNTSSPGGNIYGTTASPVTLGSGGGGTLQSGGAGGAALHLTVSGRLILDGRITANGLNAFSNSAGGGAGGSVWLTLNQFSGSGSVTADGGNGQLPNGGGAGGGRIAVYWNSNSFTGMYSAKGGNGFVPGGAGTIYLKNNQQSARPDLIFANGGLAGTNSVLDVAIVGNLTLTAGATVVPSVTTLTVSNLTLAANAVLRAGTTITVNGAATIAAGAAIAADAYVATSGSGGGQYNFAGSSGAGHGGYGGRGAGTTGGGNTYDLTANPTQPGSPGGGTSGQYGYGGGAVRLTVTGPLVLNGAISANALNSQTNSGGGGAGGTVWLTLNQFSGAGRISADGGSGHLPNGGGGGGGRIAIYYNSNAFTGTLSAKGGNGFVPGGAGTIYLKPTAGQIQTPSMILDNGGLSGANTLLDVSSLAYLYIRGGAMVRPTSSSLSVGQLNVASNSTLLASELTLTLSGPSAVEAGGRISADGMGLAGGSGLSGGAGLTSNLGAGGGGHAGYGGRGQTSQSGIAGSGGNAYDQLYQPTQGGSGGGGTSLTAGSGGGVIRLTANRVPFTLNGRITANGNPASTNSAGGGAGGTVNLSFDELFGSGSISADGGSGHLPYGGGGGGGRISIYYNYAKGNSPANYSPTNGFTGTYSAQGGNGFVKGGAGTFLLRTNSANYSLALVDNGGMRGTNTLVTSGATPPFDLVVRGGAVATGIGNPRDLFVRSNSWLGQFGNVTVSRDATFDAGGGLDLAGQGGAGAGAGATFSTPKGGGGHGGYGALNPAGSGGVFDLATSPTAAGSAGGNGSGSSGLAPFGGTGGGGAHLTVGSTLTANGTLTADGRPGEFDSGGGSGGSLWLEATTLAGNGRITARGGDGNGTAGGGGGGRVALYYRTNLFTGELSACGGAGGAVGGAGTIYLRNLLTPATASLRLDNCGQPGTNTPLSSTLGLATNITVAGGAIAEFQGAIPAISNLVVSPGGFVTGRNPDTNLYLVLLGDLSVVEGAGIFTDAKGFARAAGPGAGGSLNNQGAGGSHGGWGGNAASGAFSGADYGSATQPVARGSGGGNGSGPPVNGSEGGGAIRLAVAGRLTLDGFVSADGGDGLQDDSGGGSGGSVWISAKNLGGHGLVSANGGHGEFFGGGGGGGGRIAIYSPTNTFTGAVSVAGGYGASAGQSGTVFSSGILSGFEVVSQSPTGVVADAVSQVLLEFNEPVNPMSLAAGDARLYTPYGVESNLTLTLPAPATLRISFPPQNVPGDYRLEVGPLIAGLLAQRMSQVYTGGFTAILPLLAGTVTDTNGQPVAGVVLQPNGGLMSVTTDTNGNYALGVPYGWTGDVKPALGDFMFAPGLRGYANVTNDVLHQDFLMVATIATDLQIGRSNTNLLLRWNGIADVTYQVYWTTNLESAAWYPLDVPVAGTNGSMQLEIPVADEPEKYFRLDARN